MATKREIKILQTLGRTYYNQAASLSKYKDDGDALAATYGEAVLLSVTFHRIADMLETGKVNGHHQFMMDKYL